jgi:uncharacterized membrane protein YdbT with pleckstrin-like domain
MQSLLWSIAVVAVLRLAWMVLEWWMDVVVTDKHFVITFGVITRKTYVMPTTKVVDLSFMRPVAGQLLGYGTLRVESAGQKQDVKMVKYLPGLADLYGDHPPDLRRAAASFPCAGANSATPL